jgi:hypothetical protein
MPREQRPRPAKTKNRATAPSTPGVSMTAAQYDRNVILVLLALPLLFYLKYVAGSPMLFGTDWLGAGSLVMRDFMAHFIRSHGTIAYWMPSMLCGQPTGAAFFADMFYPTSLVRLIVPVQIVWTWTFIAHLFIAGLGTYLFLKELKVNALPAALGGVAYMLAGSLLSLTYGGHDGRLIGSALMPLALFFLHRGVDRRRLIFFLLTGLVLGLQLLSGHLQKVYYTGLILVAYFAYALINTLSRERSARLALRLCAYFLVGLGLGVALSAVQYLPIYGNLPSASRGSERGYEYASSWSMPVVETFDLLTPKFSGGLQAYWGKNQFKLHSEYLGILPLLFAFIAVLRRWKDRNVKFFTFTFAGVLLMAWGGNTPFYRIPYYLFPGISKFRGPAMIFFLAAFSLVVLAGLGLDYMLRELREEDSRKTIRTTLIGAAVPLVLLIVFAALKGAVMPLLRAATEQSPQKLAALSANYPAIVSGLLFAVVVAAVGTALVYAAVKRRLRPVVFGALTAAVMVCDVGLSLNLWNEQKGYIRGVPPPKEYFAPDEAVAFLKQDTSLHRVLPWHYERSDDGVLAYNGIQSVAGQIPNPLQTYQDFLGSGSSVMFRPDNLLNPNFMNLANIKYVISVTLPEDDSRYDEQSRQAIQQIRSYVNQPRFELAFTGQKYAVYRNKDVLPRAFVTSGFKVAADKQELLGMLQRPEVNPARTALLYQDPGFPPGPDTAGVARIVKYDCNEVRITASLATPGLLVLTDCYSPEWGATVDGRPAKVLQAYHTFRAVQLPAGNHDVVFRYNPRYYQAGAGISIFALLFLAGTWVVGFARPRRPGRGAADEPAHKRSLTEPSPNSGRDAGKDHRQK